MDLRLTSFLGVVALAGLLGCSSTVDGSAAGLLDAGPRDVPPGLNPDGFDPFRPTDASLDSGVMFVDGSTDTGAWQLPDGSVFDQRQASMYIGAYLTVGGSYSYASADFRYLPQTDDPRCNLVAAGSWYLYTCTRLNEAPPDNHPRPFPNTGRIRLTGGTEVVNLIADGDGRYDPFVATEPVFFRGGPIAISSPGTSAVPALNFQVIIPPPLETIVPPSGAGHVVLDRSRDFVVRFVPSTARTVWVSLIFPEGTTDDGRYFRVTQECHGDTGQCTLPRGVISRLPRVIDPGRTVLTVMPYNASTTRVGAWPISINAVGLGQRFTVSTQ